MKFTELGLDEGLLKALAEIGYTELTPIQEATFKPIIEGRDLVGVAETGSGKTSACGVPLVHNADPENRGIQALILVPTRELCLQYVEEISRLSKFSGIDCFAMFGGFPMEIQEAKLKLGVQILVATPGRLIDCLYNSKTLTLANVKTLVLDEADEMLNMGFWEDVEFIMSCIVNQHQTLLFSATMPKEVAGLVEEVLQDPVRVELTKKRKAPQSLDHCFQMVNHRERIRALMKYLGENKTGQVIIFCNSRSGATDLYKNLKGRLDSIDFIHGGLDQNVRTSIFNRFKSGRIQFMVATDVAGRGLDFSKVTHVVNYEMPREMTNYTHRTGRAGRMGRKGTALTLVTGRDRTLLDRLICQNGIKPNWIGKEPVKSGPVRSNGRQRPKRPHSSEGSNGSKKQARRRRRPRRPRSPKGNSENNSESNNSSSE